MQGTFEGVRFGLYTRLSQDRGGATSVERQDEEARQLVATRGGVVVGTWSDPDSSAYDERVHRPGFDALLDAADRGEIEAAVVWAFDRLTRQGPQTETVVRLMRKRGLRVLSVKEGELPLDMGALLPRMLGWRAEAESERISQRVKSANRRLAEAGQPHAGGLRGFGHHRRYTDDGTAYLAVEEDEAATIRDMARRVANGESVRSIAVLLNERGVPTATGVQWTGTGVRKLLVKPRLAGFRERDGELYAANGNGNGNGNGGGIEPILGVDDWRHVTAVLSDPSRKRAEVRTARHLLTGLCRCGNCGRPMGTHYERGSRRSYSCTAKNMPGAKGCVSVSAVPVEEFVVGAWVDAFDGPDGQAAMIARGSVDEQELADEIATLRGRLADATRAHFVEGLLTRPEFVGVKRELEASIAERERASRRDVNADRIASLVGRGEAEWNGSTLEERRALLPILIDSITITPVSSRGGRFDPERVAITWQS